MILQSLSLENFRCHKGQRDFDFSEGTTIVMGENARGKTTILEAIYMLSRGKGFREENEIELLSFGTEHGYVGGGFMGDDAQVESTITYQSTGDSLAKRYFLDKTPVGLVRYRRAQTPVVLFAPEQLDIITHSPTYRREYLDSILAAVDPTYMKIVREYESALRKRNAILETYESISELKKSLEFWDSYLVERAALITKSRSDYIDFLNSSPDFAGKDFQAIYLRNELTHDRLQERFETEASARRTLIGPQKDDIEIRIITGDRAANVHMYASRSQQRLTLLWLKMRELDYLHVHLKVRPIVLLDDIYSEFDAANRGVISALIPAFQTVVSTTDDVMLPHDMVSAAHKIGV